MEEEEEGGGGFVPVREDSVQCFKEHAGKNVGEIFSHIILLL